MIAFSFLILIFSLIYTMDHANKKIDNFFNLQKKLASLVSLNKDFDLFMSNSISYNNFDFVQKDINAIRRVIQSIKEEELFESLSLEEQKFLYDKYVLRIEDKIKLLQKLKSNSAVLNNSYRYIQKLYVDFEDNKFIKIYTSIISLDLFNNEQNIDELKKSLKKFENISNDEKVFLRHLDIILIYYSKFQEQKEQIQRLNLNKNLETFLTDYNAFSHIVIKDINAILWIIIILLSLFIIFFLFYYSTLVYKKIQLNRFKQAVESSDNIIMTTSLDQKIKYVNESFVKHTGYSFEEVVGKKPNFLKSGLKSRVFYKKLNDTIYGGNKWYGEFVNKTKDGQLSYEKASITPIFDEKGTIVEFLSIKLDITKEKRIEKKLKEKEHLLAQQSKMIAMHEMLDSIAHQWRQPLSTISTAASGMKLNKEFGTLDDKAFDELTDVIVNNTFYLSKTIDNFKTFFVSNHENRLFDIKETIEKVLNLIEYKFNEHKIELILNVQSFKLEGLEQEFIQAIVNILTNAQEAILRRVKNNERYIFVDIYEDDANIIIKVKDNGNGIEEDKIEHVFEPYFTTKHKSQGTGIGLYMTYEVVSKHFGGTISVQNIKYTHNDKDFIGAEFILTIPKKRYE